MSWTWRDLERDDSVWRFQPTKGNFFQSGRHAAEERFWKLKIHEDGSYKNRNASSMDNFYTIKDALRKEEGDEADLKRREGSVEESSSKSTEPDSGDASSSSSSDSESDLDEARGDEMRRTKKKKQKKKLVRKVDGIVEEDIYKSDIEKAREIRIRELERREIEKMRELERRERELEERERDIERRSREQTPEYNYYYRSRRNSEISNKDYPYSVASEYSPSIAPIQEEKKKGRGHETYSTRFY